MALGTRSDVLLAFNFLVEIEGLVAGGFNEVSGLQVEVETHQHREGGLNEFIHTLPGPVRYPANLTLRRGMGDAVTLWGWFQEVAQGIIRRRNGSIVLLDSAGEERWRWNFAAAYPVRWIGPNLQAATAGVAFESVELAHHGIVRGRGPR